MELIIFISHYIKLIPDLSWRPSAIVGSSIKCYLLDSSLDWTGENINAGLFYFFCWNMLVLLTIYLTSSLNWQRSSGWIHRGWFQGPGLSLPVWLAAVHSEVSFSASFWENLVAWTDPFLPLCVENILSSHNISWRHFPLPLLLTVPLWLPSHPDPPFSVSP